ncbi:hypothetical protein ABKN59_009443 [Abortiporus biennis]
MGNEQKYSNTKTGDRRTLPTNNTRGFTPNSRSVVDSNNNSSSLEEKISLLEAQLQAYASRTSILQSKLLAALDVLDEAQVIHNRELERERRTQDRLCARLDSCVFHLRKVEKDRDDLRDAASQLVERVEISNDLSSFPFSQIRLATPLEPLVASSGSRVGNPPVSTVGAAQSVISALRNELDSERKSHARTRESAQRAIFELEAKIARREAELEESLQSGLTADIARTNTLGNVHNPYAPRASYSTRGRSRSRNARIPVSLLTPEEISRIITLADAGNRELEMEVSRLSDRIEQSRRRTQPLPRSPGRPSPTSPEPISVPPRSPQLSPTAIQGSPTPYVLTPVKAEDLPDSRTTADPHFNLQSNVNEPAVTSAIQLQLETQIQRLSEVIESFAQERKAVKELLQRERTISADEGMCSADNDESMDVEDTLRVPVLVSQKGDSPKPDLAGMAPEDKDIGKSTQTTLQTDMSSNAYPKRSPSDPFSPSVNTGPTVESDVQEVLVWDDPDAEERSMELATPLQPTIILSSTNTRDWLSSVGISDSTPPDSSHENDRRTNHDHDQHLEPPTAAHILESSTNDHHHLPAVVDPVDIPLPDSDSPSPTIPGPLPSNTHIYTPTLSFAPPSTDRRESDAVVPDIVLVEPTITTSSTNPIPPPPDTSPRSTPGTLSPNMPYSSSTSPNDTLLLRRIESLEKELLEAREEISKRNTELAELKAMVLGVQREFLEAHVDSVSVEEFFDGVQAFGHYRPAIPYKGSKYNYGSIHLNITDIILSHPPILSTTQDDDHRRLSNWGGSSRENHRRTPTLHPDSMLNGSEILAIKNQVQAEVSIRKLELMQTT